MSGFRHSEDRVELVVLVDLKRGTFVAGSNVLRGAGIVSMLVDERSHQGAACPTPACCWA
jgi:hypothetical protein